MLAPDLRGLCDLGGEKRIGAGAWIAHPRGMMNTRLVLTLLGLSGAVALAAADSKPAPDPLAAYPGIARPADPRLPAASPAALRSFMDQRFGLFLHWGPVSLTGYELGWSRGDKVPVAEYDQLYRRFNPVKFDADEWVRIAKAAGMKYVVLTAKHMDGFCLWDTRQTDYNIMQSPFRRDIVRELADACHRGGLAFGVYYCIADWHHPQFPFSTPYRGPVDTPIKSTTDLEHYTQYMMSQLTELATGYGPLECVWFDSMAGASWPELGQRLVPLLRALQPNILINNRAAVAGDYVTPEERIGRYRDDVPWESCMMLGTQWSWKPDDHLKSFSKLLRALVYCAGGNGNLLLDVGPMADGRFEPRHVARLKEVGDWLARYGESIYATRGGPYKPTSYLASTRQGSTVYLHVFRWDSDRLVLPPLPRKVVGSRLLTGGDVRVEQTATALVVTVPAASRQPVDTLVRLDLGGSAEDLPVMALPPEVTVTASATRAPAAKYAPAFAQDSDPETQWSAPEGQGSATLELAFARTRTIRSVKFEDPQRPIHIQAYAVDAWNGSAWVQIFQHDNIGAWLSADEFAPVTTSRLRVRILKMEPTALCSEIVIEDVE